MMASVSRVTSSAGTSTEISRLTPSLFLESAVLESFFLGSIVFASAEFFASAVSVGLTFAFQGVAGGRAVTVDPSSQGTSRSHPVNFSVKTEGEQRQTAEGIGGRRFRNCPP